MGNPENGVAVPFRYKSFVYVGTISSSKCKVQPTWSKTIELPMNATTTQTLALQFTNTPAEIEASGYSKIVDQSGLSASYVSGVTDFATFAAAGYGQGIFGQNRLANWKSFSPATR